MAEYAELSLGAEAAAVRLPDDVLQQLVRERWTEVRPMEIDGGSQDMVSLHALVVFDAPVQQRIKAEAQRLVIGRRVQGAAVVFGGVLGLLALAWGGLRLATRRNEVKRLARPCQSSHDPGPRLSGCSSLASEPAISSPRCYADETMSTSSSETLLISRIRAGEADAWNEFIARYEGRLLGFVARRVANRAAAEDLVQETFVGFLNSLPNYDPDQSLEGYLFSIAAHKLTDLLRHEGRRPTMPLVTEESSDGWQPVDRGRRAETVCPSPAAWVPPNARKSGKSGVNFPMPCATPA